MRHCSSSRSTIAILCLALMFALLACQDDDASMLTPFDTSNPADTTPDMPDTDMPDTDTPDTSDTSPTDTTDTSDNTDTSDTSDPPDTTDTSDTSPTPAQGQRQTLSSGGALMSSQTHTLKISVGLPYSSTSRSADHILSIAPVGFSHATE